MIAGIIFYALALLLGIIVVIGILLAVFAPAVRIPQETEIVKRLEQTNLFNLVT